MLRCLCMTALLLTALRAQDTYDQEIAEMAVKKGQAALKKGKTAEAKEHFEKALKHVPDHPVALAGAGDVLQKEGDIEQAVDYWSRAKDAIDAKASRTQEERNLLIELRDKLKKHDVVGPEFEKVADTLTDLARKWIGKKLYASARRALDYALELDPDNRKAAELIEKLDKIEGVVAGEDILRTGGKWRLTSGSSVDRAEEGLAFKAPDGHCHISHPKVFKGEADIHLKSEIVEGNTSKENFDTGFSILTTEKDDLTGKGSLLVFARSGKNGALVGIYVLRDDWDKVSEGKLAVPLSNGDKCEIDARLRKGVVAVTVKVNGRPAGQATGKTNLPEEFKLGLWVQHGKFTDTAFTVRTK